MKFCVAIYLLLLVPGLGRSEQMDMRDFIRLSEGMTEAEVLYRVGPPDYESVYHDNHYVTRKIWYYIPERSGSSGWITEIVYHHDGTVTDLKRTRP